MDPTLVDALNKTELVTVLQEAGFRAHRGMKREHLVKAVLKGVSPAGGRNPLDVKRDVIIEFLELNWEKVRSQLTVRCDGNCYNCSDIQVLACWDNSKSVLERHARNGKEKE